MSKILIIADTHWGCRNDSQAFYPYMHNFFSEVVFPYIDKNNIKHFIHLGDLVDNRRQINIQTAKKLREDFFEPLSYRIKNGLKADIICGNHDVFHRQTNDINSLKELIEGKYNINLYNNPQEIGNILFLPWISQENREESLKVIEKSQARYCMAHLELKGFETQKGIISTHGDDPKIFERFDKVLSGHYHTRNHNNNINYIGSCFQFNWGDYTNDSGFCILDTDTGILDYHRNPYKMFVKIDYEEDKEIDILNTKNSYVKVNVISKKSETKFKNFIDSIHNLGVIDLLVNDIQEKIDIVNPEVVQNIESTLEIFKKQISTIDTQYKAELQLLTEEIYKEAMQNE